MKNLQNGLRERIFENKIANKCLALLLALSMTVGFVMPYEDVFESTIMSAVAAAGREEGDKIMEAYETVPPNAIPFENAITDFSVEPGKQITINNETGKATATLNLSYEFKYNSGVNSNNRYIYYKPEGVTVNTPFDYTHNPENDYITGATIKDTAWSSTEIAAYYSVSTDGLIVIKLTEEYAKYVENNNGMFKGTIGFEGEIGRADTASGDREFGFGNNKINIEFDDVIKENSKSSEIKDVNGDMVIHYTINVKNPAQNVDFTKYNFVDTYITSENADKISEVNSNPAGCISYNNGTISFTEMAQTQSSFTIEYDYKPTKDEIENIIKGNGKIKNEASITNKTNPDDKATTENETENLKDEIKAKLEKTGKASYLINEDELGYIQWEIDVERGYNFSLEGYTITDEAFSWLDVSVEDDSEVKKADSLSVTDANGNSVSYTLDKENGKITINDSNAKNVKITYKTYVDNEGNLLEGRTTGSNIKNSATVKNPNDEEDDDDNTDVPYSEAATVVKSAKEKYKTIEGFDKLNKPDSIPVELEWTVDISRLNGLGGKTYTDTLEDSPTKQWFTDEQIAAIKQSINNNGLSDSDYDFKTIGEKNKYTGFEITFAESVTAKKVTITYNSTAETKDIAHNNSDSFTNIGTFDGVSDEDTTVTITRGNDPYSGVGIVAYTANKVWTDNRTDNPTAYLMLQYRVDGETEWKNYPQIDNITNPVVASGYISWQSLPKVKPAIGNDPEKSYYYRIIEVVSDGNGGYVEGTPSGYEVSYSGDNNYDYNIGFDASQYGYKNVNITNTYKYLDATINKSWVNAPANHPEVTFTLYQSTDQSNWTVVNINGLENPKTLPATNTDVATDTIKFENLPKKDNEGNTLYYKVVESADNNALDDYVTTYGDVINGVDSNKNSTTVTNTYQKMAITAKKEWIGDEGSEDSRPASINVHLEQSITPDDENSWEKVGDSVALTSENKWANQWTDLPRKDTEGNTIYYRVREDANQTSDYEENYEVKYVGDPNNYNSNYVVQNIWKKVNITPKKRWVGDTTDTRSEITAKLQYRVEGSNEWNDYPNASPATITITSANDWTASTSWKNLPREVDGQKYYYRAVEETVPSGYVETYDEDGLNQTGESVITNTLNTIEITPAKEWKDDENHTDKRYDVKLKLQWKYEGEDNWYSITEAPVSYSEDKIITINKTDGNKWETSDKWTNLPKTYTDPDTSVRKNILYQVVEANTSDDYTALDSAISSVTNKLTVTNTYKYIDITAAKTWAGDTSSDRPDKITVHLEQSTDNGSTWNTVADSEEEITIDKSQTTIASLKSWENLPKKTNDGKTILYKVVESFVKGYGAAYDRESISESGTITITNTKKGDYSKTAVSISNILKDGSDVSNLQEITSIPTNKLSEIPVVDDCYLFGWKITFAKENGSKYVDTFNSEASFYTGCDSNIFVNYGGTVYQNSGNINHTVNGNTVNFTYNGNSGSNFDSVIYYLKVPKSTVDDAIAAQGYYELTNSVKREDEEGDGETATLTIGQKGTAPGEKSNISKSYTGSDRQEVYAKYSIELNPDAKKLSNEDYIDISDIFEVTGYKEPSIVDTQTGQVIQEGTLHTGTGLLDATIHDIVIEDLDNLDSNGNPTKLTDYVFMPEYNKTNTETIETDCKFSESTNDGNVYRGSVKSGDIVTVNIKSSVANTTHYDYAGKLYFKDSTGNSDLDNISIPEFTTDSNGNATITFTVPNNPVGKEIGIVEVNFYGSSNLAGKITEVEGTAKHTVTTVSSAEMSLRVPDEKHLRITYYYSLTANENTPASSIAGTAPVVIGAKPPATSEVYFKNEASFNTSDGKETSEAGEQNFVVQQVGATITTGSMPSIEKVNIGNYNINNLNATFKLAKYVSGEWKYATEFTTEKEIIQIAYGEKNTENNGVIPEAADDLVINEPEKINLESGVLYKLVETASPEGYIQTPYTSNTFVNNNATDAMKNFVFYFVYAGNTSAFSDVAETKNADGTSKIMQISSGGTVDIPNVEYINVSASKTWAQIPENTSNVEAEFELLYSYKRSNTIPEEKDLHSVSELGIESEKTITFTYDNGTLTGNTVEWEHIPNGKDGKAIYYYVREKSYTIDVKTYTLSTTDGNYYCNGEKGEFKSLFTGNGINEDGEVKFTNTKGLYVRKEWRTSDNGIMQTTPVDSVQFDLYGKNTAGEWQKIKLGAGNNVLGESNNWQQTIDSSLLEDYSDFKVEEVKKDAAGNDLGVTLYGYVVSYTKNLNGTSGILNISNKNPNVTKIDVIVKKEWADGLDASKHEEEITVTLYQSETAWASYTPTEAEKSASTVIGTVTLKAGKWSHTWEGLDNLQDNGTPYYYYAVESDVQGYTASYAQSGSSSTKVVTITNTPVAVNGKLTVQKMWENVNNKSEVTLELYRRKKALNTSEYKFNTDLTIACAGDSITQGTYGNTYNSKTKGSYPAELAEMMGLACGEWGDNNISVANNGQDSRQIDAMSVDLTKLSYSKDAKIVCVIIGTNNIIHENVDTPQSAYKKLQTYIETIQNGHTIFLASIPDVKSGSMFSGNVTTTNADIKSYNDLIKDYINAQKTNGNNNIIFVDINAAIKDTSKYICNDGIHPNNDGYKKIAEAFYEAIGEKFGSKNTVDTSIQTDIDDVPADLATNTAYENVDTVTLNSKDNWTKVWTDLETTTTVDGIEYQWIYYVKEKDADSEKWEVSYSHNGQPAKGQMTITVTNTGNDTAPKASLTVNKKWVGGNNEPNSVEVMLYSSASENGTYTPVSTKTLSAPDWTVTWDDLETGLWYKASDDLIGWTASCDPVQLTEDSTGENIKSIMLTNTLETGKLEIEKAWLGNNPNVDSVQVELYRVAVSAENQEESAQTGTMSFSKANNMFSLSRANQAVAMLSAQNDAQEISDDSDGGIMPLESDIAFPISINAETTFETDSTKYLKSFAIDIDGTSIGSNTVEVYILIGGWTSPPAYGGVKVKANGVKDIENGLNGASADVKSNGNGGTIVTFDLGSATNRTPLTISNNYGNNYNIIGYKVVYSDGTEETFGSMAPQGPSISFDNPTGNKAVEGETVTLAPIVSNYDSIKYSCDRPNDVTIKDNEVTFNETGTFVITATATKDNNEASATITYDVSSKDLTLSADATKLHVNGTATLEVKEPNGSAITDGINYVIVDGSDVISISSNTITALKDGTAKIKATRKNKESNEITIEVVTMKIVMGADSTGELEISIGSNRDIEFTGAIGDIIVDSYNDKLVKVTTETGSKANIEVNESAVGEKTEIIFKDGNGGSVTVKVNIVQPTKADVNEVEGLEAIQTITISKKDDWKYTVSDLPTTDGNGNYYQYYIKEVDSDKYYPISYTNNGATLDNEAKSATIKLKNKPNVTEGVELPSVGGIGTRPYTVMGLAIMATSAAIMFIRRRRRRSL